MEISSIFYAECLVSLRRTHFLSCPFRSCIKLIFPSHFIEKDLILHLQLCSPMFLQLILCCYYFVGVGGFVNRLLAPLPSPILAALSLTLSFNKNIYLSNALSFRTQALLSSTLPGIQRSLDS